MKKKKATRAQKRKIDLIVLHCSASDNPDHDNIATMRRWHKRRGWRDVGYHYFIRKDGKLEKGRAEYMVGAHVSGHNSNSIGICLHGNDVDKFTEEQFNQAAKLLRKLLKKYKLGLEHIKPHNYFTDRKTCPNYEIGRIVKRIYDE